MKTWVKALALFALLVAVLIIGYVRRGKADAEAPEANPASLKPLVLMAQAPQPAAIAVVVTPPAPPTDALVDELDGLMHGFVPSYADHEDKASLDVRRHAIAQQLASAAHEVIPDAQKARRYAILLAFIGQRETRYALNARLLGNEDNGAAHGYWQVHQWQDENPYLARTAMEMLASPRGPENWALPDKDPWIGCPPAASYLAAHP